MSAFRDLEHAGWTSATADYDDAFSRLTTQSVPALLEAVRAGPGVRLLDIACGPGHGTAEGAKRGARATGLDFSATMLALARSRHPSLEFVEGDAEKLPFPDASFDAVTMNYGLLHLDRPDTALAEAARVLAPGGRFAFTVWAPPDQARAFGIVLGAVARHGNPNVPLPPGPPFFRFSDPAEAARSLSAAGLVATGTTMVPQHWSFGRAGELFDAMLAGTVRTAALLKAQAPQALREIAGAIEIEVASYRQADGGFALPMPSVLSGGRKA